MVILNGEMVAALVKQGLGNCKRQQQKNNKGEKNTSLFETVQNTGLSQLSGG